MNQQIIIIGAGASGLMAAYELAKAGQKVIVLEASERIGGRMYTAVCDGFEQPLELGAEFVHGELPLTLSLLKEAGIAYKPVKGKMLNNRKGKWNTQGEMIPDWDGIIQKMGSLKEDMTLAAFLQEHYSDDQHMELRFIIQDFAEGFDLADITQASVFALKEEWENEHGQQYRIVGGYRKLAEHLHHLIEKYRGEIHHNAAVNEVKWIEDKVTVFTADGQQFVGNKLVVTVSPRVLQDVKIKFDPALDGYLSDLSKIGFGSVIKVFLQFEEPFWHEHEKNTGFVVSDQNIPTWWTQSDKENYLLTGWLGGPEVMPLITVSEEEIIDMGLQSLSNIYGIDKEKLRTILVASTAIHWAKEEWIMGGYSYGTLQSKTARKLLKMPVDNTIFFAGEALYEGSAPGTVEAALANGQETARKILQS
ncbi:flavin monoamine oxidase family protein [Pinibacter aurantiacus]|uniref:Tryptophan 2-monooxygenase n=1 Tax=Pinibacter aurantiacus TaxID=2851599 RepID=A0A9E2SEJ1_9BACT|nr:NAD(P)/FAD-dependent oxidoreductase [Pinibacter aurantiacus]MBV4358600.1 FAD-dependent oxidoreductase [Pinibacter aurantiacus]